ncbi:MAG: 16S rRNA (adenine(1518)-N(6)/adenine(1519)-N(6))-dimethyltransferase RsmA [Coriobacteriaceae bacterium]|nr:16S rRNA (adenine(1518)-N(6)/adenine(1519)-N(6))-dimethyltransferase RsmA [Coriobacteriaceae bacterium]
MPHSPLATPSATLDVLARHGLRTRKALGQHFLVDDNVVGRILTLAALRGDECVVEVGPGIGTLTAALCRAAGSVLAVEKDAALLPALEETIAACGNVRIVRADAAGMDVRELGEPEALVANLPYNVAATVVLRFFETIPSLASATVMVQAEVADRMAASPGGRDYGAYTVKLGLLARSAGRFAVPRTCFLPPPRVDSAVLRLERAPRDEPPELLRAAAAAANAAFAQRRKTLRNSLSSALSQPTSMIEETLRSCGIDGSRRAETLDVDEYVTLGAVLRETGVLP